MLSERRLVYTSPRSDRLPAEAPSVFSVIMREEMLPSEVKPLEEHAKLRPLQVADYDFQLCGSQSPCPDLDFPISPSQTFPDSPELLAPASPYVPFLSKRSGSVYEVNKERLIRSNKSVYRGFFAKSASSSHTSLASTDSQSVDVLVIPKLYDARWKDGESHTPSPMMTSHRWSMSPELPELSLGSTLAMSLGLTLSCDNLSGGPQTSFPASPMTPPDASTSRFFDEIAHADTAERACFVDLPSSPVISQADMFIPLDLAAESLSAITISSPSPAAQQCGVHSASHIVMPDTCGLMPSGDIAQTHFQTSSHLSPPSHFPRMSASPSTMVAASPAMQSTPMVSMASTPMLHELPPMYMPSKPASLASPSPDPALVRITTPAAEPAPTPAAAASTSVSSPPVAVAMPLASQPISTQQAAAPAGHSPMTAAPRAQPGDSHSAFQPPPGLPLTAPVVFPATAPAQPAAMPAATVNASQKKTVLSLFRKPTRSHSTTAAVPDLARTPELTPVTHDAAMRRMSDVTASDMRDGSMHASTVPGESMMAHHSGVPLSRHNSSSGVSMSSTAKASLLHRLRAQLFPNKQPHAHSDPASCPACRDVSSKSGNTQMLCDACWDERTKPWRAFFYRVLAKKLPQLPADAMPDAVMNVAEAMIKQAGGQGAMAALVQEAMQMAAAEQNAAPAMAAGAHASSMHGETVEMTQSATPPLSASSSRSSLVNAAASMASAAATMSSPMQAQAVMAMAQQLVSMASAMGEDPAVIAKAMEHIPSPLPSPLPAGMRTPTQEVAQRSSVTSMRSAASMHSEHTSMSMSAMAEVMQEPDGNMAMLTAQASMVSSEPAMTTMETMISAVSAAPAHVMASEASGPVMVPEPTMAPEPSIITPSSMEPMSSVIATEQLLTMAPELSMTHETTMVRDPAMVPEAAMVPEPSMIIPGVVMVPEPAMAPAPVPAMTPAPELAMAAEPEPQMAVVPAMATEPAMAAEPMMAPEHVAHMSPVEETMEQSAGTAPASPLSPADSESPVTITAAPPSVWQPAMPPPRRPAPTVTIRSLHNAPSSPPPLPPIAV